MTGDLDDEMESLTLAGALWDDVPCCDEHERSYWSQSQHEEPS